MATVSFRRASRIFGKATKAVNQLNLEIADGELVVLVGPSGCGKTTSLRMLAGLEPVDEGDILIDEQSVAGVSSQRRDIAMVFQDYALYPHMTVAQNLGFALEISKLSRSEIRARVAEAARTLGLEDCLDRKPAELSGGQCQRVAMGRAIVRQPRVFLMDEPLSNLDAKLRVATRSEIAALQRRLEVTTVYVTHDQVEAMTMGDRVAVLKDGVLQQVDVPSELYDEPANAFVASFIGSPAMNLVEAIIGPDGATVGSTVVEIPRELRETAGTGRVTVGVRPESVTLSGEGAGVPAIVNIVEELGAEAYIYARQSQERAPDRQQDRAAHQARVGAALRRRLRRAYRSGVSSAARPCPDGPYSLSRPARGRSPRILPERSRMPRLPLAHPRTRRCGSAPRRSPRA
jgi:multiple sugar transport system ATP-binding protein